MNQTPLEQVESFRIGTVEYVAPDEIRVVLEIDAPSSISLNTGEPRSFPRVNSYALIPSDQGYLVGQVEWLTIEQSPYPKRRGMRDFGLVDLPYPLRKMSLSPLGTLRKKSDDSFEFKRGADSLPTVGDSVLLPTKQQLQSIVESGKTKRIKIGTSPIAGNADVYVDPDRLFGRHLAVLGNTGSGKSCSVAGIIRWSLEAAQQECEKVPNARFIVLDPNGEYKRAFSTDNGTLKPRIFRVDPAGDEKSLQVPLWFWNSEEWCSFTQASGRAQRPILQQALRLRKNAIPPGESEGSSSRLLRYLQGVLSNIIQQRTSNAPFFSTKAPYRSFVDMLKVMRSSLDTSLRHESELANKVVSPIVDYLEDLIQNKATNEKGYPKPFEYGDIAKLENLIDSAVRSIGGSSEVDTPKDEDLPIPFSGEDLLIDLEFLATNSGNRQWFDAFMGRIRTMLTNTRMKAIVGDDVDLTLTQWLEEYIGEDGANNGCLTIIDLSLVPSEIIHIVTAVVARMVFEALQRYRKSQVEHEVLPTVLVMEEAHTFIKRYREDAEFQDSASVCCRVFERIAREGRKFGLGLLLSSQRPSELSPTVLSQCNTFLIHRISNDDDQKYIRQLVPDNLKGLLRELPLLSSQHAILLGWASELPVLVRMSDLPEQHRPSSDDPDFWEVWTRKKARPVDWKQVADEWQGRKQDGVHGNDEQEQPGTAAIRT